MLVFQDAPWRDGEELRSASAVDMGIGSTLPQRTERLKLGRSEIRGARRRGAGVASFVPTVASGDIPDTGPREQLN